MVYYIYVKIGLVPCAKKKRDQKCAAKDLYISPLWRSLYGYTQQRCDATYILSAKYGLVADTAIIEPYDKTLLKASVTERKEWSDMVLKQMRDEGFDFENDYFVCMAGKRYRQYIAPHLQHLEIPNEHLNMYEQLKTYSPYMISLQKL